MSRYSAEQSRRDREVKRARDRHVERMQRMAREHQANMRRFAIPVRPAEYPPSAIEILSRES